MAKALKVPKLDQISDQKTEQKAPEHKLQKLDIRTNSGAIVSLAPNGPTSSKVSAPDGMDNEEIYFHIHTAVWDLVTQLQSNQTELAKTQIALAKAVVK